MGENYSSEQVRIIHPKKETNSVMAILCMFNNAMLIRNKMLTCRTYAGTEQYHFLQQDGYDPGIQRNLRNYAIELKCAEL